VQLTQEKIETLKERVNRSAGSTAFARLADHYRSTGSVDSAIALCEAGLKSNPEYITGHLILGRCYYEKERVEEAKAKFQTVLELDNRNVFALKILGDIHIQSGNNEVAADFYRRAAECDPLNEEIRSLFTQVKQFYHEKTETAPVLAAEERAAPVEAAAKQTVLEPAPAASTLQDENQEQALASIEESLSGEEVEDEKEALVAEETPQLVAEPVAEAPVLEEVPPSAEIPQAAAPVEDVIEVPSAEPAVDCHESAVAMELLQESAATPDQPVSEERNEQPHHHDDETINKAFDLLTVAKDDLAPHDMSTEMVDLPPEMVKEKRIGDFRAKQYLYERILTEQNELLDYVTTRRQPEPELPEEEETPEQVVEEEAPAETCAETLDAPVESEEEIVSEETLLQTESASAGVSASAPGMDGFYNVVGDDADSGGGESLLATIDDVNIEEAIAVEEAAPAVEEPGNATARAETDEFDQILDDIGADDDLKNLVDMAAPGSGNETETRTEPPVAEEPRTGEGLQAAEITEEIVSEETSSQTESAPAGVSASAPGMDGFYNVVGDDAGNAADNDALLAAVDDVQMVEAITEEDTAVALASEAIIEEDAAIAPAADVTANAAETEEALMVELGADVEIIIPAIGQKETAIVIAAEPRKASRPRAREKGRAKMLVQEEPPAQPLVSSVATASLAEIYLKQGHAERALAVYRKLVGEQPGNEKFRERIRAIEEALKDG